MTLKDKIEQIDLDKIADATSRVKVQAFINKVEATAEASPDDAMNLIDGLIGKLSLSNPQALRTKITKAEAQKKVDKIKKMKNIVPQKADIVKIKAQIAKQYPTWDDDRVEELANIRIQAQIDRADSFNKMIDNLEKTNLYAGKVSNAPIDYVAPKEPSRVMRNRNLPKDAKTSAVTEAEELRSTGRKFKRKSPTYGKSGGAKRPYYYEYRMNRRDVDNKIQLAKGGYADPENNTHVLHIDGQNWYLEKIDSTHFYMSNAPESRGMAHHIGQHNGEPYYDEVRTWLKESGGQYGHGGEIVVMPFYQLKKGMTDEEQKDVDVIHDCVLTEDYANLPIGYSLKPLKSYRESGMNHLIVEVTTPKGNKFNLKVHTYDLRPINHNEYAKGGRLDRVQFTKLATLGYRQEAPNQWRFVDLQSTEDLGSPVAVGDIYKTKKELLADLDNFAEIRGYEYAQGGQVDERYNVVKVFRKSGRREILEKNLTLEEARRVVARYPNSNTSMVVFMKMYAKGGEVSIPNADKMMHLPMEVAVYVPSTSNVDKEISATEMKARVKEVETYLAELFGGFTSSEKVGGYLSGKSGVITEKVVPVTAFATSESFSKNKSKLVNKLAVWAKKWSQEAMGLEFEGDLYYVPQKFKKGGRLTATYIPNEDIESIKTRFGQTFSGKDVLDGAYVKRKVKTPKMSRTQFEEETYEYAKGGSTRQYDGLNQEDKFIADQIYHVIALRSISEKKNVIKNSILPNLDIYNLEKNPKRIVKDNLEYALTLKSISSVNNTMEATINALRSSKFAEGGSVSPMGGQFMIDYCWSDVYVDDYEQGEMESKGTREHDFMVGVIFDFEDLFDILDSNLGLSTDPSHYTIVDNKILTSRLEDADGDEPTESKIESWKKGKTTLYSVHYTIGLKMVVVSELNDEMLSSITKINIE